MPIKARLKRLQKKVAANEPPTRDIGMFAGKPIWKAEDRGGIIHFVPLHTVDEFSKLAMRQQTALLVMLNEMNEEGEQNVRDTSPASMGFKEELAPGAKPLKYRYYTDASGQEWQVSLEDGQTWRV